MLRPTFSLFALLPLLALTLLASGCARSRKEAAPQPASAQQRIYPVGKVATVNRLQGFVLIDAVETLQPGTPLRTLSPTTRQETSTLSVSTEQSRPFYIGEVGSGRPERGDLVVRAGTPVATSQQTPANAPPSSQPRPVSLPDELPPLPATGTVETPASIPLAPSPSEPDFPPLPPLPDPGRSAFD